MRGLQQASLGLTNSKNKKIWEKCTFCIFDIPDQNTKVYEKRVEFLKDFSNKNNWPSFLHVIDVVKCNGKEHLNNFLAEIVEKKGEGVMLREPGSLYESGRSNKMKKYKEFVDTEVKVIKNKYPYGLECEQ